MSRRTKSKNRRPRRTVMPEVSFESESPSLGRRALNAGQTLAKLVAIGIPAITAVQLLRLYPKQVRDALYSIGDFPESAIESVKGIPGAMRGLPQSILDFPKSAYDAVASIPENASNFYKFINKEGEGIGGVRRRSVRKKSLRAKTPARRRTGRGEIGGAAKRPLTAYQKFVKKHRKPGISMANVAKMWHNR